MQEKQKQIISHGYRTQRTNDALAQRRRDTRRKIDLQCPVCSDEIQPTDTTHLQCLSCDAPVEVYQHRELTETADRRVIYIHVSGQRRAVLSLDLHCLSCEQRLTSAETCTNTCPIQTYLVCEHEDAELYISRLAIRSDAHFPREPTEIQTRTPNDTDSTDNETPHTQNQPVNQPPAIDDQIPSDEHPNRHTDVKGQVLAHLTEHHIATTPKLRDVCNCSPEALNQALQKLINAKQIRKVKRGVYELINHT